MGFSELEKLEMVKAAAEEIISGIKSSIEELNTKRLNALLSFSRSKEQENLCCRHGKKRICRRAFALTPNEPRL
jgi:hypothetical protein